MNFPIIDIRILVSVRGSLGCRSQPLGEATAGSFAPAALAALLPSMLHCSVAVAVRAGASLSVLLSCAGSGGAVAPALGATCLSLPAVARPGLAAAHQVLNLRSLHCSSSVATALQHTLLAATSVAQQMVSLHVFCRGSSQSSGSRRSSGIASAAPWCLYPAATPALVSLRIADRSMHAAARGWRLQRPQLWQRHAQRGLHVSSSCLALGVVDKLHDELPVVLPADGRSRHFWEVRGRQEACHATCCSVGLWVSAPCGLHTALLGVVLLAAVPEPVPTNTKLQAWTAAAA